MKRIFLLVEDFTELTFLETLLKKVGFDTMGSQVLPGALEKAMGVTPEILILSDIIKSQSTHDTLEGFKRYRPSMNIVLLKKDLKYQTSHNPQLIDVVVKSPIDPEDFLRKLAQAAKLNEELIVEKFHKLGLFKGVKGAEKVMVQGGVPTDTNPGNKFVQSLKKTTDDKKEVDRRKRFTNEVQKLTEPQRLELKEKTFDHKVALKEMRDYRDREGDPEIQEIDQQRKNFCNALFKKK